MFISRKKWKQLEKRVAALESSQSQPPIKEIQKEYECQDEFTLADFDRLMKKYQERRCLLKFE